jgi:hypothetical protein
VAIQIEQRMPKCGRCGRMIHQRAEHVSLPADDGRSTVVLCSKRCQREYEALLAGRSIDTGTA